MTHLTSIDLIEMQEFFKSYCFENDLDDSLSYVLYIKQIIKIYLGIGKGNQICDIKRPEELRRLVLLAESFFMLQKTKGFEKVLEKAKKNGYDDNSLLTECFSPGRIATFCQVKFKKETGVKGDDFDLEVIFKDTQLQIETKCHLGETGSNFRSNLNQARKQLTKGNYSIIIMEIHYKKYIKKDFENWRKIADEFFLENDDIKGIILYCDTPCFNQQNELKAFTLQFLQMANNIISDEELHLFNLFGDEYAKAKSEINEESYWGYKMTTKSIFRK